MVRTTDPEAQIGPVEAIHMVHSPSEVLTGQVNLERSGTTESVLF